jgi:hypothetical protein
MIDLFFVFKKNIDPKSESRNLKGKITFALPYGTHTVAPFFKKETASPLQETYFRLRENNNRDLGEWNSRIG